jgi:TonB family protein
MDKTGKPIWLDTNALLKNATHCVAPQMPALARQARIEGQVLVDILVDREGKVACVHLIQGHPLLAASAIDAAKDWTFGPRKQKGREVSFYGHLRFHFSTGQTAKSENPCTVAHW